MSTEVATSDTSTPCTGTSIFENDWKDCGGGGPFEDLEAVAEFNANFGDNDRNDIDPQVFNTPPASAGTLNLLLEDVRNQQTQKLENFTAEPAAWDPFVDGAYTTPQMADQAGSNNRVATSSVFDPRYRVVLRGSLRNKRQ